MTRRIHRTLLAALLASGMAGALPENGQVIQGNLQISQPQNHILQILQSSPTGIINWGSFNIDANQLVQFLQPGATSALLNRVVGQDPSQILGQIQANGRIFLVNPNGILFGPGSSVNAGSFLATTLSIQDQDFIQGRYNFQQDPNSPLRAVVNQGEIHVTDGGFIALVSPLVDNQGLLVAQQGQVVLGATTQATLQVDARGLLQVSIPDGFKAHSQAAANPQTVLLTPGQMSDTLAQLVRGGYSEGDRIIETAQGIQLVGGEGLLVNQGTVRSEGGRVLMDSSQATVNTEGSLVSASAVGDAGEILVLSRGSAVQLGELAAASSTGNGGFIEVSGRHVHLEKAPDLSAPQGQAGHLLIDPDFVNIVANGGTNPTFPVNAGDAPSSLSINASALDTAGTVTVQAQIDLTIDPGVAVTLTQATDLTLQAVDGNLLMSPGSSISASNPATTVTLLAGNAATVHDIQAPNITVTAGDRVDLRAGQFGNPALPTVMSVNAPHILVGNFPLQADINVEGTSANVSFNATEDMVFASRSNFNINSPTAYLTARGDNLGVTQLQNSTIQVSGTGNISLNSSAGGGIFLREDTLLRSQGAANITLDTNGVLFSAGTIQSENAASQVTASAGNIQVATVNVPTMTFNSPDFVQFLTGNLGVSATDTVINVNSPSISFDPNSDVHILGNHSQVTLTSSDDFGLFPGANVQFDNSVANLTITSPNGGFLADNASLRFNGSANVTVNSGGTVRMLGGSSLATTGLGNVSLQTGAFSMDIGSTVSLADPASRLTVATVNDLTTADVAVSNIDLQAGGSQFFNPGTLGRAGGATVLNASSGSDLFYFAFGAPIRFAGNSVNYNQTAVGTVIFVNGADIRLDGTSSNNVSLASGGVFQTGGTDQVNISGAAPTRLQLSGAAMVLDNSRINLPNSASNISIQSNGVARLDQIKTGSFNVTTTAGNVRVLGQIEANDLTINTPLELVRQGTSPDPALIAHNSLNITADRISGPVNVSEVGLVQGFPIATDSGTQVRINVTGTNSPDLGNRAANIFYYFPQSGDVQLTHANGDVLVYNQPNPNPPPPPPPNRPIQTREDLTSAQFVDVTGQAAQAQIQLSNLYSAAYLPSTSSVLMLGYNNIGLTHFAPVPLSTPLLELAVVSPEDSAQTRARSEDTQTGSTPSGATTGTSPRTDGTSTTTSTSSSSTTSSTSATPGRGNTPTVETGVLSPESSATSTRNRDNTVRDDQANSMVLAGNDEDEELRYWRRLIEGFIIWEE